MSLSRKTDAELNMGVPATMSGRKSMRFAVAATLALFGVCHFPEAHSEESVDGILANIKREDTGRYLRA